jgi:lipoprotein signal peptidase
VKVQPNTKRPRPLRLITSICLLVAMDQVVRAIVRTNLTPGESIPLLGDVLRITFAPNFSGFSWWVPELPTWTKPVYMALRIVLLLAAFPVYLFYTRTRRQSIWADVAFVC